MGIVRYSNRSAEVLFRLLESENKMKVQTKTKRLVLALLICSVLVGAAQAQDEHKFFDKTNIVLFSVSTGAMVADLTQTVVMVGTGNYHEVNPMVANLINHHGVAGDVAAGVMAESVTVGLTYLAHRTGHHKIERAIPLIFAAGNATCIVHNNTRVW